MQTRNPDLRFESENSMRPALVGKMNVDPVLVAYEIDAPLVTALPERIRSDC